MKHDNRKLISPGENLGGGERTDDYLPYRGLLFKSLKAYVEKKKTGREKVLSLDLSVPRKELMKGPIRPKGEAHLERHLSLRNAAVRGTVQLVEIKKGGFDFSEEEDGVTTQIGGSFLFIKKEGALRGYCSLKREGKGGG